MRSKPSDSAARQKIVDAAYRLFYAHGIQAIGVDRISSEAGVGKMTLYRHFQSKSGLVAAYLERRDGEWRGALRAAIDAAGNSPAERIHAWFDVFEQRFASDGFYGCAFINADAERIDRAGAARVAAHKNAVRAMLLEIVNDSSVDDAAAVAEQIFLLTEGALVTARLTGATNAAASAREAALSLLAARAAPNA